MQLFTSIKEKFQALFQKEPTTPKHLLLLIIFAGVLLRLAAVPDWNFGFDQVQIIEAAQKIAKGDITLIGPRTGPAALFTGPLIYYITAFFYLLGFSFYSLIATTIVISLVTGLVLFFLVRRYFDEKMAVFSLILWSFSWYFIKNDQVTWNPNLTILASILLFFPLVGLLKNKPGKLDYFLLFCGSFLGYQAHFSGFVLIPLTLLFFISTKKIIALRLWIVSMMGFAASLLPTVLFDIKNNWLNVRGVLEFIQKITSGSTSSDPYLYHLWKSVYTSFESLGSVIFGNFSLPLLFLFLGGVCILILYLYLFLKSSKNKGEDFTQNLLPVLWLGITILIFSFYSGDKPPYYFLIQVPAYIYILFQLYSYLDQKYNLQVLLPIFILCAVSLTSLHILKPSPFSLTNSLAVQQYIQDNSVDGTIKKITYHVPAGEYFGLEYLLAKSINPETGVTEWYASYPNTVMFADASFNRLQLWKQPRSTATEHSYFDNEFRIFSPASISLFKDPYYTGPADQNYLVIEESSQIATIERYSRYNFLIKFSGTEIVGSNYWQALDSQRMFWYYPPTQSVFILSSTVSNSTYETISIR
jgi:hypothetical protein